MEPKAFEFDFRVEGMPREEAEKLLEIIQLLVEVNHAEMAGGFVEASDEDASAAS